MSFNEFRAETLGSDPEMRAEFPLGFDNETETPGFLTPREVEVVSRLAAFRFLFRAQLEEFLFSRTGVTQRSRTVLTHRVLDRLGRRGLVVGTREFADGRRGGSGRLVEQLTPHGRRVASTFMPGLPRAARRTLLGTFLMRHATSVAEVALAFDRAARARRGHRLVEWQCDWQGALRLGAGMVVPDAWLAYRTPDWELSAFVEVDLGTEGTRFFTRKIDRYLALHRSGEWSARFESWPLVLIVAPAPTRANALRRACDLTVSQPENLLAPASEFRVATFGDVVGPGGPLGPIWMGADGHKGPLLPSDRRA